MRTTDIFSNVDAANRATLDQIVTRLEMRQQHPHLARWRQAYINTLPLETAEKILENGCGTGVVTRMLARQTRFKGQIVGSDRSSALIAVATQRAVEEELQNRIAYRITDAHALDFEEASFDIVLADTLLSHVDDPARVLAEIARVLKAGGLIVIFDGDYTSLSFEYPPDPVLGKRMDEALRQAAYANPNIMRQLPRMIQEYNIELAKIVPHALVEVGTASDRLSFIKTHVRRTPQTGLVTEKQIETWLAWQIQAMQKGHFFGVCNYYTYFIRRF